MIKWYGENVKREVASKAAKGIKRACLQMEREAKKDCPFDTGHLMRNIRNEVISEVNLIVGRVGTNVHYARY